MLACTVSFIWPAPAFTKALSECVMSAGISFKGLLRRFLDDAFVPVQCAVPRGIDPYDGRHSYLVIDASGSMLDNDWPPSRLGAAKEAAIAFCTRLAQEDPEARVAIVAYGDGAEVFCPPTAAREAAILRDAIERIECLGGTNIRAGLEEIASLLRKSNGACDVVLLSDGHNTGSSPKQATSKIKEKAVVSCVGIGGSPDAVDEELMQWIASENSDGSKRYRWIGNKERLVQHFQKLAGRITRG